LNTYSLLLLFFLTASQVFSQGGFNRRYYLDDSYSARSRNVIEAPNGDLIIVGLSSDTLDGYIVSRLTVVGTDASGKFLWRKSYGDTSSYYLDDLGSGAVLKEADAFYHALSQRDTSDNGALVKFNYQGDTLWQRLYRKDSTEAVYIMGMARSVDNGFLLTGIFENLKSPGRYCMLIKTDNDGNELWRRKIGKALPNVSQGKGILQDSTTKKIIIVGYQYIGSNSDTYSNILILDSLGSKIIQTTFNNSNGGGFGDLILLKDGNFLSCGSWRVSNSGSGTHLSVVVKFDIDGKIIWRKTFDHPTLYNGAGAARELPNGEILIAGVLDTMEQHLELPIVGVRLLRLSSSGNLLSARFLGTATSYHSSEYMCNITATRDKGYVIGSWFPMTNKTHPFSIIKIDSTGCDSSEAYCSTLPTDLNNPDPSDLKFQVYPVPATDGMTLTIHDGEGPFVLRVFDVSARLLMKIPVNAKTSELSLIDLRSGIYFIQLQGDTFVSRPQRLTIVR
jgi:hypothetical protein